VKKIFFVKALILISFVLFAFLGYSQEMKTITWVAYKTKFNVPGDFYVTKSTDTYWEGNNTDISISIYPKKDENLSQDKMNSTILTWATDNGVIKIGEVKALDSKKVNGYNGVFCEGEKEGFIIETLLIVDPDFPENSLYIWISYKELQADMVFKIITSFTPN
jgi:hypothetical protein